MVGRVRLVGVIVACTAVLAGCGDDRDVQAVDDAAATGATSTTYNPRVDDSDSEANIWSNGSATLDLGDERHEFVLDFCATQPVDESEDATTITLQVDGTARDDPAITLRVVESVSSAPVRRIQVVSVHFDDVDGTLVRAWEAQRVIDPETGEVDDMHGGGTTALLEVDEGDELTLEAVDGAFWQFDMTGGDDELLVGTGTLSVRCTP